MWHSWGRSPVWILICLCNFPECSKDFSHIVHLNCLVWASFRNSPQFFSKYLEMLLILSLAKLCSIMINWCWILNSSSNDISFIKVVDLKSFSTETLWRTKPKCCQSRIDIVLRNPSQVVPERGGMERNPSHEGSTNRGHWTRNFVGYKFAVEWKSHALERSIFQIPW